MVNPSFKTEISEKNGDHNNEMPHVQVVHPNKSANNIKHLCHVGCEYHRYVAGIHLIVVLTLNNICHQIDGPNPVVQLQWEEVTLQVGSTPLLSCSASPVLGSENPELLQEVL